MKLNVIPENSIVDKPWSVDMNDIGMLLLKALARKCNLKVPQEIKSSSLELFLFV